MNVAVTLRVTTTLGEATRRPIMVSNAIEVLGWTLLHFVWQGTVVGMLAAILLAALRGRSANARYVTAVAALGLMLLLPLLTLTRVEQGSPLGDISPIVVTRSNIELPRSREDGALASNEPPITVERIGIDFENPPPPDATPLIPVTETGQTLLEELSERRSAFQAESFLKPFIPWTVAAWLIGVGVLSLRLFGGWLRVQRLRRLDVQPTSETWQALLRRLAERLRVTRPVQLVESALVEVPAVIGWLRPVILLPATALTGLTTEQLEALLAHELAHVRRHDYLVNLLQTVVETLLFYHPAVWWLSHRIRIEREHCCDDLAVQVCGDGLTYAKALVALEELRVPKLGLAMSSSGGSLLTRVARLLGQAEQQRRPTGWIAGLLSLVLFTMAGALGAGLLTPPDKPTEGLPNVAPTTETKSTEKEEETSGPTQRRGQETRAEREVGKHNSVRERLQSRISLLMENAPLSQVIEHIGREAKIEVRLDSDGLENEGIGTDTLVSISLDGISTAGALQLLMQPIQLGYLIENEALVVTTVVRIAKTPVEEQLDLGKTLADEAKMGLLRDAIHTFVEPKKWDVAGGSGSIRFSASRKEFIVRNIPGIQYEVNRFLQHVLSRQISQELQRLRKLLAQRFTLEVGEVTLLEALREIAIAADANVVLDSLGLHTVGVRSDQRVTLSQKDAPLRDILDDLCKPFKLRFRIRNEVIQITDEETAQGGFVAVLYPISTPADDLANRLQKSIRPESWKVAGGQGTIEPHRPTNSLIIRQHEIVHDEIEAFFAKLIVPNADAREATCRFVGRVRLKTEKPLPDLSNVKLPPGKILDESLVFSKDGGLANVFVYLRKPTFKIEEPADAAEPKPFVVMASGGRFLPHLALVRVGRPLEFANADKSPLNFRTAPTKNAPENRLVPPEERVAVPAFNVAENLPVQVGSNVCPWMSAWMFPLDHPFAAVTDADGRFSINGLPPGEHEFRVWHERVGYLNKKLVVTIKSGEETRTELEYEPSRFDLSDDALRAWSLQVIDVEKQAVPRPKVPPVPNPAALGEGLPTPPERPTEGLPISDEDQSQKDKTNGDLRSSLAAGSGDPRRASAKTRFGANVEAEKANRRVREALKAVTAISFADAHFDFVRGYLGDVHRIPLEFDASVRERFQDFGQVRITIHVEGEDLETVLQRVLHGPQLSYFVEAGTLWIATPEEVKRRGYPIPRSFADLLSQLHAIADKMPWERLLLGRQPDAVEAPPQTASQVDQLTKLLSHADVIVRRHSAQALAPFGARAAPARPELEKLINDRDLATRRAAWWGLLSIGRDDRSTWPLFLAAWLQGDAVVEENWLRFLEHFDGQVFETLTDLYPESSVGVRRRLAASIRVWPESRGTLPLALLAMNDDDPETRAIALATSQHSLEGPVIEILRARLRDDVPDCRIAAAARLLHSARDREAAVAVLLNELGSETHASREQAIAAFAKFGTFHTTSQVRDLLLRRTVSTRESERLAARQALKVVPEHNQMANVLKHVDLLFEIRKDEPKFSAEQRVQVLDDEIQDLQTRNNPSEEQRARVSHRVAQQFANWDIRQHFGMVRKYAIAGLELDVAPDRRASLYSLLGSAALVDSGTKSFVEQRRKAAKFWLEGYRKVAALKLPQTVPELPVVEKLGDVIGESSEEQAAREQRHAAQMEARQQAEFLRTMIEHRHQLARLLVEAYRRDPADERELRKLATDKLIDKSLVEALLAEGAVPLGALGAGLPTPPPQPTAVLPNNVQPSKPRTNDAPKTETSSPTPAAGSGDPRRAQEVAQKAAAVARAEYEKILEANRRVPGSIPETEVERARLAYEKALLIGERLAVECAIAFLKSQQQENGAWQGTPADGVSALCATALLQAGVKADDPVMQKALAHLRTIKPTLSYTVALQTMVFCAASPKDDAELIRRNVAWLEKAQATEGRYRGGWSYMENNIKIADGSCSRFAMLGLHAAKKAGFEVKPEIWRNASEYWMSSQRKDNHAWGYQVNSGPTPSMTLSGMACLAIVNQHLPQDEQTKLRSEAIERAVPFVEPNAHLLWQSGHGGYALHCLERAAHLNRWQKFGKHELQKLIDEKLIGLQRPEGHWTGVGGGGGFFGAADEQTPEQKAAAEAARRLQVQSNDLIATSFALMCLTGQPESKQNTRAEQVAPASPSRATASDTDSKTDPESKHATEAIEQWREATDRVASYEAEFDRWEYDYVFNVMKQSEGTFRWKGTDQWRLELRAPKVKPDPVAEAPHWKTGKLISFRTQSSEPEVWTRTGQNITQEDAKLADDSPFKRHVVRLPEVLPRPKGFWEKLAMAPMLAAASHFQNPCLLFPPAKESRYDVSTNSLQGNTQLLHLRPRGDEASDYPDLHVILDQRTSLPWSVRMTDPAGTKVTVIRFRTPHIEWRSDRVQR